MLLVDMGLSVDVIRLMLGRLKDSADRDKRVTNQACIEVAFGELERIAGSIDELAAPPKPITIVNHIDVSAGLDLIRDNADVIRKILQNEVAKQGEQPFETKAELEATYTTINWLSRATPEALRAAFDVAGVDASKMLGERNGTSENPNHPASGPQPVQWNITIRSNEDIDAILFGIRAHHDWSKIKLNFTPPYPTPPLPEGTLIVKPDQFATFTFGLGTLKTHCVANPGAGFGFFEFQQSDTYGEPGSVPESMSNTPVIRMEFTDAAAVLRVVSDLTRLALLLSEEQQP